MDYVRSLIRYVPDFPIKGINFCDYGKVYADPKACKYIVDGIYDQVKDLKITKVLVIETRGYIVGCPLAGKLGAGIVPVRKFGKLPGECITYTYDLEYKKGEQCQIQTGLLSADDVVLIHDDLIATGGTAQAAIETALLAGVKPENIYVSFITRLAYIDGMGQLKHMNKAMYWMDL